MTSPNFQIHKQQVLSFFEQSLSLIQKYGSPEQVQNLQDAQNNLLEGKLFVVICGEYKKGKSSLINALLNEVALFPVDVDITTSLVSTITYGETEQITVFLGESDKTEAKKITRQEIKNYVTEKGNRQNAKRAKLLAIQSPNLQLKEGLILADTPGVGGLNVQHTGVTYALIPNADVVLFVSDALTPLTTEELEFVKKLHRYCQNFLFVVTRIDQQPNFQDVIASNREKLASTLEQPPEKLLIIPVSSYLKQVYLQHKDPEDLKDSNFEELESQLWQLLNRQRGAILSLQALKRLTQYLLEVQSPLQAAWEVYQSKTKEEIAAKETELRNAQHKLQKLLEEGATWRIQLSDGLMDIRSSLLNAFQERFNEIKYQNEVYTDDKKLLADPNEIISLLEQDIDGLMTQLNGQLSQKAAALHTQVEDATELRLGSIEVGSLIWQRPEIRLSDKSVKRTGWWDKTLTTFAQASFKASVAGALGGLFGGIVGTIFGPAGTGAGAVLGTQLGATFAGIAGFGTGAKQALEQIKDKEKYSVLRITNQFLADSQQSCQSTLNESVKILERSMRDELTNRIKQEQNSCKKTIQAITESRKLSQEEVAKKAAALKTPLQQLQQLLTNANQFAEKVFQHSEMNGVTNAPSPQESSKDNPSTYGDFSDE